MPPDPTAELTRAWLLVAAEDLAMADLANRADPPVRSGVAYHCQQAFEKALKACLVWHGQPVARTHALPELVARCEQLDPSFSSLAEAAARVTPYGVAFRYPPIVARPSESDAAEALHLTRQAVAFVRARLPDDARP